MAYSATKFQLSRLLQNIVYGLGVASRYLATGGSTTTLINSAWHNDAGDDVYEDNDDSLLDGAVIVDYAAGVAPEGEFGIIKSYLQASTQITIRTALTQAVAAGHKFTVVTNEFPLQDILSGVNVFLRTIDRLPFVDSSLTMATNQTEYTLPTAIGTRPIRVAVQTLQQSGHNLLHDIPFTYRPAAVGSQIILEIPEREVFTGYALYVWYEDMSPHVELFDAEISPLIHPQVATLGCLKEILQWYNDKTGGINQKMIEREGKIIAEFNQARAEHSVQPEVDEWHGMPQWGRRDGFVPGTSDRLYGN